MATLIAIVSRWLVRKLVILLAVLAILLLGAWVRMEWIRLSQDKEAIAQKQKILAGLREAQVVLDDEMSPKREEWERLRESKIADAMAEVARLDAEIREKGEQWTKKLADYSDLEKAADAAKISYDEARTRRDQLGKDVGWWQRLGYFLSKENRRKVDQYGKAEAEVLLKEKAYKVARAARDALKEVVENSPVKALQERRQKREADLKVAQDFKSPDETQWKEQRQEKEIADFETLINYEKQRVASDPRQRFVSAIYTHLPTAVWILVGIILAPIIIKAVFYYGLAPIAAKFPPIRIVENCDASMPVADKSDVSISFDVSEGSEVLVHPDYLQSSSQPAVKQTQWLLNRSLPFSSIASGMFFLTRIRPADGLTTRVVVSSQNDAFGEIGVIHLPAGASMVVQPRSLAGVVKRSDGAVRITRHWRISSLHAWLTLQLRFLVFHGPCDLILKGCRGVRAEAPDLDRPRMINQASTIGFSANLDYHNTRCETFISYLRGKEDLFNDLFGGEQGVFVYEEMPAGGRKAGLTGRGLEGVVDAALKIFGI